MNYVIKADKINFSYSNEIVIRNINLLIPKSELTLIIGANGVGKSTLLKILCGILNPDTGNVLFNDIEIKKIQRRDIAMKIAYVSQEPVFSFPFTVKEVVLLGRSPYIGRFEFERDSDFQIAEKAMDIVGISHLKDRLINKISGGERQIVSLARAIAQEPEVMILDEPGTFLDLKHKSQIYRTIKELIDEMGMSIIIATHDISSLLIKIGSTVLLKDGEIFASGKSSDVINESNLSEIYETDVRIFKDGDNLLISANTLN